MNELDPLRRDFIDALARCIDAGMVSVDMPTTEITDPVRDLAMSSQYLVEALDS